MANQKLLELQSKYTVGLMIYNISKLKGWEDKKFKKKLQSIAKDIKHLIKNQKQRFKTNER